MLLTRLQTYHDGLIMQLSRLQTNFQLVQTANSQMLLMDLPHVVPWPLTSFSTSPLVPLTSSIGAYVSMHVRPYTFTRCFLYAFQRNAAWKGPIYKWTSKVS